MGRTNLTPKSAILKPKDIMKDISMNSIPRFNMSLNGFVGIISMSVPEVFGRPGMEGIKADVFMLGDGILKSAIGLKVPVNVMITIITQITMTRSPADISPKPTFLSCIYSC